MAERFTRWDSADYLETEEDIRLYLDACCEEDPGDGSLIRHALEIIARVRNQTELAHEVGMSCEGLRTALGPDGNPSFTLILKLARALGLELQVVTRQRFGHEAGVS